MGWFWYDMDNSPPLAMRHDAIERACTRQLSSLAAAQWQGACQALHGMQLRRLRRNVFGDSAAVSACEKGKQWKVALGIWAMVAKNMGLDLKMLG